MFDTIIRDLGLTSESQGDAAALHLLLTFARDNGVTSTFSGNPFSAVKALLSAGRTNGYRQVENLLSSGEMRWASRR
jgi:hypothetical protein